MALLFIYRVWRRILRSSFIIHQQRGPKKRPGAATRQPERSSVAKYLRRRWRGVNEKQRFTPTGSIMRFVAIKLPVIIGLFLGDNVGSSMAIDSNELLALPIDEKLRLVEMLWDNLGQSTIPLPEWVTAEVARRREEMRNPSVGLSHEEVLRRIRSRNG
jgi:putative addiction module component (TIGR02574 family)